MNPGDKGFLLLMANALPLFIDLQRVVYTAKRIYKKKFLIEVEELLDSEEDRRGQKTLQNLKSCNIRSVIYIFVDSVKEMESTIYMEKTNNSIYLFFTLTGVLF